MANTVRKYQVTTSNPTASLFQFWPLDLAMLLFSALILVLVLRFLDFEDTRIIYNAWTYLIGVPAAMVIFSMVLRVVVNRVVEKSMQLSFLASVIIHLILLLTALNVVIFARYWPDIFESNTVERTPRQITVPEYFKPTLAGNQQKPDYLRPVQTEHDAKPTEANKAVRPNESELKPVELPTHEKRTESTVVPFTIPKAEPTPSQPSVAELSQTLDRQPTRTEEPESQKLELPKVDEEPAPASQLEATNIADNETPRTPNPRESVTLPSEMSELPKPRLESVPELPKQSAAKATLPEIASAEKALPRQTINPRQALAKQYIEMPAVAESDNSANPSAAQARDIEPSPKPLAASPTLAIPEANLNRAAASPSASRPLPSQFKSSVGQQMVEVTPGDQRQTLTRKSAGGIASMPAPTAARVIAPAAVDSDRTADESSSPSQAMDRMVLDRDSAVSRQSAASSIANMASGPEVAIDKPRASSSNTGTTPMGLSAADSNKEGPAITDATANSPGSAKSLSRSQTMAEPQGTGAVASSGIIPYEIQDASAEGGSQSPAGDSTDPNQAMRELESRQGDLQGPFRDGANVAAVGGPVNFGNTTTGPKPSFSGMVGDSDSQASSALSTIESAEIGQMSGSTRQRNPALSNTEGQGIAAKAIDIPQADDGTVSPSIGELGALDPANDSMGNSKFGKGESVRSSFTLDGRTEPSASQLLGEPTKGLDPTPRDIRLPEINQGDLQTQRFLRSDVGGPTIAGAGVPVPAPAFSRRLDRNREKSPDDSLGPLGPETEEAIERGLAFLAKHQREDGSWHLEDFDTKVDIRSDAAATALAVLAFQGAGYTHRQFEYAAVVSKALQYLVDHQKSNGDLYIPMDTVSDQNAWLYTHSIAALALSEAYGMTQDATLQEPAQRAVNFMVASQDKTLGGWRYRPGTGTDTSVTGWFMMALKSAQLAGLDVPKETFLGIQRWVEKSQASTDQPHLYRYNWMAPDTENQRHGRMPTPVMTSVGLLLRLHLGWQRDNPNMIRGAEFLLERPPAMGTAEAPARDTYYWYYSSQVLFHMGGDYWRQWNQRLHPLLINSQVRDGDMSGSWEPLGEIPDAWGKFGGRLYVTTLNLLSLEVYYRHLPLYDATAK